MTTEPIAIVPAADLLYLLRFAAGKDDVRASMRGVHIEPSGIMVATDGYRMGVLEPTRALQALCSLPVIVADSRELRAMLRLGERDKKAIAIVYADKVVLKHSDGRIIDTATQPLVDGTFPDWRRVLPKGPFAQMTAANFVVALITDFPRDKKSGGVTLYQNSSDDRAPYLVRTFEIRFTGVLMPRGEPADANEAGLDRLRAGGTDR